MLTKLRQLLDDEYDKLEEQWEDLEKKGENPFDKWNQFLDNLGLVDAVSYEYNWNEEWGIPNLITRTFEVINGNKQIYVIDFNDGSNMGKVYFFDRQIINERFF